MSSHSDWLTTLPEDLLTIILRRLVSSSDYLRFSLVCKSWFRVAKDNQRQHMSTCQQPPMLLISNPNRENSWNLYNAMDDTVLDIQLKVPNRRFCGSSKGWLIFVDESFTITLIKPFPAAKKNDHHETVIRLPPLDGQKVWIKNCDYYVLKASLSADPVTNPKDCVLMVIYVEQYRLALIRPGDKNKDWTYVDERWDCISELVYSQGKIYAVGEDCKLFSYDIDHETESSELCRGISIDDHSTKEYLVLDSNDKQFWMIRRYTRKPKGQRETTKIRVFKMKFDELEPEWTEVETLGDAALFIGDNSSVSVVASNFTGCRSNCIYFNHDDDCVFFDNFEPYGPHDYGVYDMTSRCFSKPYADDAKKLLELTRKPSIWFVPPFQL